MTDEQKKTDKPWLFQPGQSGNPKGRPKGISITEMVKKALEEVEPKSGKTWKDLIVKRILMKAVAEGDGRMLTAIWSYIDGLPKQKYQFELNDPHEMYRDMIKKIEEVYDSKAESRGNEQNNGRKALPAHTETK